MLVGPHAHVTGARVGDGCFIATRATAFNGAVLEAGVEVRIGGVVHVNTRVPAGAVVPIGWVAVGDPAQILPPAEHDRIWEIQRTLDFPGTVWGVDREAVPQAERILRYARALSRQRADRVVEAG